MIIKLTIIIGLLFTMTSSVIAKTLKLGIAPICPYVCDSKEHQGYIIDILKGALKGSNIKIKVLPTPHTKIKSLLISRDIDLALLPSYEIWADDKLYRFQAPIGVSYAGIVTRQSSHLVIYDIDDLINKNIIMSRGKSIPREISEKLNHLNTNNDHVLLMSGENLYNRELSMISSSKSDVLIEDYNMLRYKINVQKTHPELSLQPSSLFGFTPLYLVSHHLMEDRDKLDQKLVTLLAQMRSSNALNRLLSRYKISDWKLLVTN